MLRSTKKYESIKNLELGHKKYLHIKFEWLVTLQEKILLNKRAPTFSLYYDNTYFHRFFTFSNCTDNFHSIIVLFTSTVFKYDDDLQILLCCFSLEI